MAAVATHAHSEQELKDWKRHVNIEQREQAYLESAEAKLKERYRRWELDRTERQNRQTAAKDRKNRAFHQSAALKRATGTEIDYHEKMRQLKINQKEEEWRQREAEKARELSDKAQFEERQTTRILGEIKQRKIEELQADASKRAQLKKEQKAMDVQRSQKIDAKEKKRVDKYMVRVRRVLNEYEQDLDIAAEKKDSDVPMRSTLVHSVGAPVATDLMFALRDLRENMEDLREADMEVRSKALGTRVFQLVREMEDKADEEKHYVFKSVGIK